MSNTTINSTPRAKIRRVGAGRTRGAFSFVPISLNELNTKFADKTMKILMSRKQAQALGFENLITGSIGELTESIAGQTTETAVKVTTTEF